MVVVVVIVIISYTVGRSSTGLKVVTYSLIHPHSHPQLTEGKRGKQSSSTLSTLLSLTNKRLERVSVEIKLPVKGGRSRVRVVIELTVTGGRVVSRFSGIDWNKCNVPLRRRDVLKVKVPKRLKYS